MVVFQQTGPDAGAFLARPNNALGWVWMKRLFLFLTACVAAVAAWFAAKGAWLVLPFAGLEIVVVGLGIYLNARWSAQRELIRLEGPVLRIERGRRRLTEVARMPRHWTRVSLVQDPRGWYPSRLLLECHGRRVEVGSFLVESERARLAEDLRSELGLLPPMRAAEPLPVLDPAGGEIPRDADQWPSWP